MIPRLISHAPGQHQQEILNPRLTILQGEQGAVKHEASARQQLTPKIDTHLKLLDLLLELVDRQTSDLIH